MGCGTARTRCAQKRLGAGAQRLRLLRTDQAVLLALVLERVDVEAFRPVAATRTHAHARTHARTHTRTHARTHTHTHTHTHTQTDRERERERERKRERETTQRVNAKAPVSNGATLDAARATLWRSHNCM